MNANENMNKTYKNSICNDDLTFEECELAILRHAIDENDKIKHEKEANSPTVIEMISILEEFLRKKKCICYGGTAINNILPKEAQFYNRDIEVPDYDFYSKNALDDAKELADIYFKKGYTDVEAKSGMHYGTFKVFVNFIPIADITQLHKSIFDSIRKESIAIDGIVYAPPNFLRMSMYLELSRPNGDTTRWEKVLKRLTLLNKYYPFIPKTNCEKVDFQRNMDTNMEKSESIYYILRDAFIKQGVVFFGGYASSLYSRYMPKTQSKLVRKIPDFDVLSEDYEKCANFIIETLKINGFDKAHSNHYEAIGEIIPERIEILVGNETLAFIYKPIACHNYNEIITNGLPIKVATIDTMLSFYLAFYYSNEPYYFKDRILCMSQFLFDIEEKNRLDQRGLLKRFNIRCYGKQPTIETIRAEKVAKFKELKNKRGTREYDMWFLKYHLTPQMSVQNTIKHKNTYKSKSNNKNKNKNKKQKTMKNTKSSEFLF